MLKQTRVAQRSQGRGVASFSITCAVVLRCVTRNISAGREKRRTFPSMPISLQLPLALDSWEESKPMEQRADRSWFWRNLNAELTQSGGLEPSSSATFNKGQYVLEKWRDKGEAGLGFRKREHCWETKSLNLCLFSCEINFLWSFCEVSEKEREKKKKMNPSKGYSSCLPFIKSRFWAPPRWKLGAYNPRTGEVDALGSERSFFLGYIQAWGKLGVHEILTQK